MARPETMLTNKRVIKVIRALGREVDVPGQIVEAVLQRTLPSIRLFPKFPPEAEAPTVGGCRIGRGA